MYQKQILASLTFIICAILKENQMKKKIAINKVLIYKEVRYF